MSPVIIPAEPPDGTLFAWKEIADAYRWQTLLLGNGLSINVWPPFRYDALFNHAKGLTEQDRALFQGTPNFEWVLGEIHTAMRVGGVLQVDTQPFYERYESIQRGLWHAIREVHLRRSQVPDATLGAIRTVLEGYEWIFTTSYDLVIYWAMGHVGHYRPFIDLFRGSPCEFNPSRTDPREGEIPVYFLHGALHLVVGGSGVTRKRTRTAVQTLLEQFGQPIKGDPQARPLLVTEGTSQEKLRVIEGNAYLTHALDRLRQREGPTVVFGSRLGDQDKHLSDALGEQPDRPIAVSMMPGTKRDLALQQIEIYGRLKVDTLIFFDATTHPLGSADLRPALP